jgi:hypothetical protein
MSLNLSAPIGDQLTARRISSPTFRKSGRPPVLVVV